jgi:1,4-dihydroxy-2-naphthoyl-CoA synthase
MPNNNKFKIAFSFALGAVMGYVLAIHLMKKFEVENIESCERIRKENKILKRMIETKFNIQQDSVRCGYAPTCGL